MKKNSWEILFFLVLMVHLAAIWFDIELLRNISKPFILISLILLFATKAKGIQSSFKKLIFAALLFSLAGDIFLMFENSNPLYFLLGLSSFLVAHIFYIVFFNQLRVKEKIGGKAFLMIIVVVYFIGMMTLLSPHLGPMKSAVYIYAIVISLMLMLAMHAGFIANKQAALLFVTGAILFVLSDSLLAINKFYASFPAASFGIMITYGLAQYFIVSGALNYINGTSMKGLKEKELLMRNVY